MSLASAVAFAAALVILYVACFHARIWWLRRREMEHLWLAVAALAIAGVGCGAARLYSARTVEEAQYWQRLMLATSFPLLVGFFRFSFRFLELERPWADRIGFAFSASVAGLAAGTDWIFTAEPVVHAVPLLGMRWVEASLSPLGRALMAGYFAAFAYLIGLYARHLPSRDEDVRALFLTVCLWFAAGSNDMAVGLRLYEAPYLLAFGYLAIVLSISGILVRRFVHARVELERLAARLNEEVEARTEELRRSELELAQGRQLATIGTLAASVAHEINNPIAFVHSNLNRLEELWARPESADEVREILAECREGSERVRLIVSDLLRLSRKGDGPLVPVDLHEVVATVLPLVRGAARRRARIVPLLGGVPRVLGDPKLLGQVVLNLVLNALQAIPEGTPEVQEVRISTGLAEGRVRLEVADTGPGIPEEHRARIFDPLYTARQEGTGLGLAVTHQIVTRHGGRIRVESGPSGTRVTVELPPHLELEGARAR
jgi:signal transduction histidine kinase